LKDVATADEGLRPHQAHLQYRWAKFVQRRRELEVRARVRRARLAGEAWR
jgi:hypothetical protein